MCQRSIFVLRLCIFFTSLGKLALADLGVRALSMGSAYRAVATGNEALFFNPAGMPFFRRFNVDADYIYQTVQTPHLMGVSLVDSVTNDVALGFDFHMGVDSRMTSSPISYLGTFALAYPISDMLAIGASLKYTYETTGKVDANFGLLMKLPFGLSLAIVGYDNFSSVGFGSAFNMGATNERSGQASDVYTGLVLAFDWLIKNGHQLSVGGEYYLFDLIPLRAGYTWQKNTQSVVSAGLGLFLKSIELDFVFQQDLNRLEERRLGGALRVFFP